MNLRRKSFISRILLQTAPWLAALALLGPAPAQAEEGDAWVGVMLQELTRPLRDAMDLEAGVDGVVIAGVIPESPAEQAGLLEGDLILSMKGQDVSSVQEVMDRVRAGKPGDKVEFAVQRDGKRREVSVTLGSREDSDDVVVPDARRAPRGQVSPSRPGQPPRTPAPPDIEKEFSWSEKGAPGPQRHREMMRMFVPEGEAGDRGYLGVSTIDLGEQLASYFEVTTERGVLVTEVAKDSPAEAAGVRAGDVILALNKSGVDSPRDLMRLVRAHDPKDQVEIEVKRKGATMLLNATLGEAEEGEQGPMRMFWRGMDQLPRHLQRLQEHLGHLQGLDDDHIQRRFRIVRRGAGAQI